VGLGGKRVTTVSVRSGIFTLTGNGRFGRIRAGWRFSGKIAATKTSVNCFRVDNRLFFLFHSPKASQPAFSYCPVERSFYIIDL
jgi:hypothetical protein